MTRPTVPQPHILVVDDDKFIRVFVKAVLAPLNAEFSEAGNGQDALRQIAERRFDAVLLDINMPGIDGLEVCRQVRGQLHFQQLPIIIMTALDGQDIVVQAFDSGATDYVHKPINQQELLARTQAVIARRQAEQALYYAKKEAEAANRAKSEFISSMSHELRTPLNSVLGFAQLLESDAETPLHDEHRDYLKQILGAGWHLLRLINDILDLSKVEAGVLAMQPAPALANDLVDECMSFSQTLAADHGIGLECRLDASDPVIYVDETRAKQVLVNLISNAIKYNRPQGSVMIEVTQPTADQVRISISDTGFGIPTEKMAGLFQPFNRLGAELSEVEGSGIGLALTKRMVEHMQGCIGLESKVGFGSTFWVEFDRSSLAVDGEEPAEPHTAAVGPAAGQGWHVLYIEDNATHQRVMAELLKRHSQFRLSTAGSGAAGLRLAQEERPDLILLDFQLPDCTGLDVFAQLQAHPETRAIPVLGVSSRAMKDDMDVALRLGFRDYLTKPFTIQDLLQAIQRHLH
jgi:signal transduction histidine kinase